MFSVETWVIEAVWDFGFGGVVMARLNPKP